MSAVDSITAPLRFVDAHLHCWDRQLHRHPWLDEVDEAPHAFGPDDLPEQGGPWAAVFVEGAVAEDDALAEAAWAADIGAPVRVVVAHASIELGVGLQAQLEALAMLPEVTGVRRLLQDLPDEMLSRPRTIDGLRAVGDRGLVFDACIRHHQLKALVRLVQAAPSTTVVLDHLGKPPVRSGWGTDEAQDWHRGLLALAAEPSTVVKLSGLAPEAGPAELAPQARPFLEAALDAFGPGRAMVGSDWPVSRFGRRDAGYSSWFTSLVDSLGLHGAEREQVLERTAVRVYRIRTESPSETSP